MSLLQMPYDDYLGIRIYESARTHTGCKTLTLFFRHKGKLYRERYMAGDLFDKRRACSACRSKIDKLIEEPAEV